MRVRPIDISISNKDQKQKFCIPLMQQKLPMNLNLHVTENKFIFVEQNIEAEKFIT